MLVVLSVLLAAGLITVAFCQNRAVTVLGWGVPARLRRTREWRRWCRLNVCSYRDLQRLDDEVFLGDRVSVGFNALKICFYRLAHVVDRLVVMDRL
jgi:predicted alpha/beta hydrolase